MDTYLKVDKSDAHFDKKEKQQKKQENLEPFITEEFTSLLLEKAASVVLPPDVIYLLR